jgi:adenylate kinase family enzyme
MRIMIIGQPGSGKSTLARDLGERLGLPVIHIDHIHWQPGWSERTRAEKTRLCREAESRPEWVFEGGHSATWETRLARADMLVWLDRPTGLRLRRVITRSLRDLGRTRPDMAPGCPERLRNLPGFVAYILRTRRSSRNAMAALAARATCPVVHLTSDAACARFLAAPQDPLT